MENRIDEQKRSIKRQIAYKVRIKDIINGKYVKNEGEWSPNYIEVNGKQVSRVNLIGTIVLKPTDKSQSYQSVIVDDGTEKIAIRTFEGNSIFDELDVGEIVLFIGRPREFGSEKYIVPEIVKKVKDSEWVKVRKLELEKERFKENAAVKEEIVGGASNSSEKIVAVIKDIDSGNGADVEEVISRANIHGAERLIKRLLEEGEIFEIKSGKLKVLE